MKQIVLLVPLVAAPQLLADPPEIVGSEVSGNRVSVTLEHADTGWDDYADGWRIETANGTVIGTRELLHPHVNEQPFTRSLSVDTLPEGPLFIRARDNIGGWSDSVVPLNR